MATRELMQAWGQVLQPPEQSIALRHESDDAQRRAHLPTFGEQHGNLTLLGVTPRLVVVCFQFGARDAARKLSAAGVDIVVWIAMDVHDPRERGLLEVIVLPMLEILQAAVTEATLREARDDAMLSMDFAR